MATQPSETLEEQMADPAAGGTADTGATEGGEGQSGGDERDFEAEARHHGWTPKDEFKGDPEKWVDAEEFVRRADTVMPFLKKQNAALKREAADIRREMKKAQEFFSKAEQRGYERAMTELEAQHDQAVEEGDVEASRKIRKQMAELKPAETAPPAEQDDEAAARKRLDAWVQENDWYVTDENRRNYADLQARLMGPATEWEDGPEAYLEEIAARVGRKFEAGKVNPINPGGGAPPAKKGGKTFNDLPPEAKQICDKWVKQGVIKSRDDYVNNYDWS